jgi:hypothetical protein
MTEEIDAGKHFDFITRVMKENENFLLGNAGETYDEVLDLIEDSIEYVSRAVKRERNREEYVKHPIIFFLHHILMPSSYAIQTDLLTGNLPACFMQLRLMLESLAKCYHADLKYPDKTTFREKLELLEKELEREHKSTSKLMKELGGELGLKNDDFVALWGKLSQDWIHTKGIVDRIVKEITGKSAAPSWTFIIPIRYTETDLDTIEELGKRISQFRGCLKVIIGRY